VRIVAALRRRVDLGAEIADASVVTASCFSFIRVIERSDRDFVSDARSILAKT